MFPKQGDVRAVQPSAHGREAMRCAASAAAGPQPGRRTASAVWGLPAPLALWPSWHHLALCS